MHSSRKSNPKQQLTLYLQLKLTFSFNKLLIPILLQPY